MFRILIPYIIVVLFSSLCSHAQKLESSASWTGELSMGINKLHIEFSIKTLSDGTFTGTMDVPEQGAKNIPISVLKNDSDSLNISIPALRAVYRGRKLSAESIEGKFSQNGAVLDLNLKHGKSLLKRPQTPNAPYAYKTEEVLFSNEAEGAVLSGTLTYPINYSTSAKKQTPVVLMVTGSGGQDRNEEIFGHKPFLVIADYLARHGIASLRYDDRGMGKSTGPTLGTTTQNNLADANAGISYLRKLNKFGKVGIIGHSEGGTIAFMLGAEKSVDFLVSLAGSAANGIDVIVGQNEAMMQQQGVPQEIIGNYAKALRILYKDRVEGKEINDPVRYTEDLCNAENLTLPGALKTNLSKCVSAGGEWFTWFLRYSPAEAIRKVACPVMALNGTLDLQVLSRDNIPVIRDNLPANSKNIIREYESLNHLFQHCTPATALNYGAIEETISEEVLSDMVGWINELND